MCVYNIQIHHIVLLPTRKGQKGAVKERHSFPDSTTSVKVAFATSFILNWAIHKFNVVRIKCHPRLFEHLVMERYTNECGNPHKPQVGVAGLGSGR